LTNKTRKHLIVFLSWQVKQVKKGGSNKMKRKDNRVSKSVRVKPDLWQIAKSKAVLEGKTMQTLIEELLGEYIMKKRKGGKK